MRHNLKRLSGGRFIFGIGTVLVSVAMLGACATQQPSSSHEAHSTQDATTHSSEGQQSATSPEAGTEQNTVNGTQKDTCGADPLKMLIGKSIAAVTMPASQNVRVIGVNTPVTRDFRPDRINIEIDETAIITKVYCG
ncbi:I78 family peptidase inhibitor [Hirschia litorea]|uniref:I78 family peptidase inhibitor n=1 Tax=Hirschia litorea TaxID=1199156 RepID=A0ABW2IM61_9PROT